MNIFPEKICTCTKQTYLNNIVGKNKSTKDKRHTYHTREVRCLKMNVKYKNVRNMPQI